ncbi:MAG: DUF6562 domain-containing protein, partial [Lepagella sp.]
LLTLSFVTSCDETIHFYPEPESSLVILQLNVDRDPPTLYKRVVYDDEWKPQIDDLSGEDKYYDYPSDYLLRITVEVYRFYGSESRASIPEFDETPVIRRVRLLPSDTPAPIDTIHCYLPDGQYKALAFVDYVPIDSPIDWHYRTAGLFDITTDLTTYPHNQHLRNAASGSHSFTMTHQLMEGGFPTTIEESQIPIKDRVIPIDVYRANARIKIYSTDWRKSAYPEEDMSIKWVFKDYIPTGFCVWTQEPNDYITTYSYITKPPIGEYDPETDSRLMVEDYIFAPSNRDMVVHAYLITYDKFGNIIKASPDFEFPISRNKTTIIYAPTITVGRDDVSGESGFSVDENFEGEITIVI